MRGPLLADPPTRPAEYVANDSGHSGHRGGVLDRAGETALRQSLDDHARQRLLQQRLERQVDAGQRLRSRYLMELTPELQGERLALVCLHTPAGGERLDE